MVADFAEGDVVITLDVGVADVGVADVVVAAAVLDPAEPNVAPAPLDPFAEAAVEDASAAGLPADFEHPATRPTVSTQATPTATAENEVTRMNGSSSSTGLLFEK